VLAQGNGFTLLICRPETGRKHQIRRHACLAGHPLAGDRRYGPEARAAALARQGFRRLALHAWRLELCLPGEGRPRVLESGRAPAAMLALVGGEGAPANLDAVGRGQWD
jgi:23S rRNA-/tRNA-specific pseudouridylate synthase